MVEGGTGLHRNKELPLAVGEEVKKKWGMLNAAIELNLFEIIAKATPPGSLLSASEIASQLPNQYPGLASRLERMLRLLASYNLLICFTHTNENGSTERVYGLSEIDKYLAVCHNWPDDKCEEILRNCYKAQPLNGKVIVVEFILPETPEATDAFNLVSGLDNLMFIIVGGKERTEKEFKNLCKRSGVSKFQVACCAMSALGVMEFHK
ncbi:hypothetical protein L6164_025308 [Bauhinia variegata]|uniref:Uncharacterized protein n=1 Tax=Bauhinia variegata TaxID=167791 RepID=A0ACB9M1J3_BAUVA|nr:hypothetical protein L6164_025308 [Bauhinia variegata]